MRARRFWCSKPSTRPAARRTIYAEVLGYGVSCDSHHMTAAHPQGDGAVRAMAAAMKESGVPRDDIDYISAHGTGTPTNDRVEAIAVRRCLVNARRTVPMSSIKSMIGHTMGAASAIEAAACALALDTGWIPPTMNYEEPDPECDLDYVPNQARKTNPRIVLNNAYAFGGNNASLCLKRIRRGSLMPRRVVVTGAGVISSIGAGMEDFARSVRGQAGNPAKPALRRSNGRGALIPTCSGCLQQGHPYARPQRPAAQRRGTDDSRERRSAARRPKGDAGLGLVCGTMFGSVHSITSFDWSGLAEGPNLVNPMEFPNTVINSPAGQAAIRHKLRGVNSTMSAGLASGLYASTTPPSFCASGAPVLCWPAGWRNSARNRSEASRVPGLLRLRAA